MIKEFSKAQITTDYDSSKILKYARYTHKGLSQVLKCSY